MAYDVAVGIITPYSNIGGERTSNYCCIIIGLWRWEVGSLVRWIYIYISIFINSPPIGGCKGERGWCN